MGVELVTLHVGIGTFKPVTADLVEQHTMHAEWGEVPANVADRINTRRGAGGRVVAVVIGAIGSVNGEFR